MADLKIHPDFQKLIGVAMPSNSFVLRLMNAVLDLADLLKIKRFGDSISRTKIIALDGRRVPLSIIKLKTLKAPAPALLYFHGGTFILKASPQHIANCVRYAIDAECCVIFVDYRLAPQHPFPAGFNDCYSALQWAFQNAEKLGIDKQRIAVGGDSAGGAIAASVAQKAAREGNLPLCGQLLIYPVTDAACTSASSKLYNDVSPLKRFSVQKMWKDYLGHLPTNNFPAYASPLHGDLAGVAPAYVESAEFDPLHDEAVAYAQALMATGNRVELNETKGTVHGYDLVADSSISLDGMKRRVQFLREIFRG